jgi:hypothetical protein
MREYAHITGGLLAAEVLALLPESVDSGRQADDDDRHL